MIPIDRSIYIHPSSSSDALSGSEFGEEDPRGEDEDEDEDEMSDNPEVIVEEAHDNDSDEAEEELKHIAGGGETDGEDEAGDKETDFGGTPKG